MKFIESIVPHVNTMRGDFAYAEHLLLTTELKNSEIAAMTGVSETRLSPLRISVLRKQKRQKNEKQ